MATQSDCRAEHPGMCTDGPSEDGIIGDPCLAQGNLSTGRLCIGGVRPGYWPPHAAPWKPLPIPMPSFLAEPRFQEPLLSSQCVGTPRYSSVSSPTRY